MSELIYYSSGTYIAELFKNLTGLNSQLFK